MDTGHLQYWQVYGYRNPRRIVDEKKKSIPNTPQVAASQYLVHKQSWHILFNPNIVDRSIPGEVKQWRVKFR